MNPENTLCVSVVYLCLGRDSKYPEDLDARTLYAEALMDLQPWTPEILEALKYVIERNSDHPGQSLLYPYNGGFQEAGFSP